MTALPCVTGECVFPPMLALHGKGVDMTNVIKFPERPAIDVTSDASEMFEDISKSDNLSQAVVLGWTKDGQLFVASNMTEGPSMRWLLDVAQVFLDEDILTR